MRYLITGINGTVGGNIFRYLQQQQGSDVWGVSNNVYKFKDTLTVADQQKIVQADLSKKMPLALDGTFDIVIHAAAVTPTYQKTAGDFSDNKKIANTVATFAEKNASASYFLSTGSVYQPEVDSCDEGIEPLPVDDYGKSMLEAEVEFKSLNNSVNILRLFYPYCFDEYSVEDNLISKLRKRIQQSLPVFLSEHAKNKNINPVFFRDVLQVVNTLISSKENGTLLNIAGPDKMSFFEMIAMLFDKEKKPLDVQINNNLASPFFANTAKLSKIVAPAHFTSFNDGIKFLS